MTNLRLNFVDRYRDRHGKLRHYFRRPGRKLVALPGLPGSAEFMEAYGGALAGDTAPRLEIGASCSRPGSVAAVWLILERFRENHGERSFATLQRKHVEFALAEKAATPHAAKSFLKALRAVVTVALRAGLCETDLGIRVKVCTSPQGFRAWAEDDIEQFEAFYPIGSRERLAFALLLYLGQRRGDRFVWGASTSRTAF